MLSHGIDLGELLIQYACLLFSLCVHEAAHAVMANRCGDPSARLMGRATLNPLAHIDPIGTVVMPLLMMVSGIPYMFGWAKPVPFNPRNLHNMRRDPALIGLAGPAANLLLALTAAVILRFLVILMGVPEDGELSGALFSVFLFLAMINFLLMLFNLIPVPPLDGSHLLGFLLGPSGQRALEQIGPFGILIAIFVGSRFLGPPLALLTKAVVLFALWGQT